MEKTMNKRKYISPLVEELGFESEVRLLAGSVRQQSMTVGAQFENLESEDFYDGMPPATTTTTTTPGATLGSLSEEDF